MDPLSALGIAAAAIQFLQFAGSLVSKSRQIHAQGALIDHIECANATNRLSELANNVQQSLDDLGSLGLLSDDSENLRLICSRCVEISEELSTRLSELRLSGNHQKWKSVRQALKSICSKGKVDELAGRLASCKDELNLHLVASIRYAPRHRNVQYVYNAYKCHRRKADSLEILQQETLDVIKETSKNTIEAILESRDTLQTNWREQQLSQKGQTAQSRLPTTSSTLIALGDAQSAEIYLLLSLRFPTIIDRYIAISDAHKSTFRWILADSDEQRPWSNFPHWLRSGEGIYWINGKAGSGKSTLMRYIYDNPQTLQLLKAWAGTHQFENFGFFFWNSGTTEQRSQAGLLRSLLYQALQKRPNTVRDIFPNEIAEISSTLAHRRDELFSWTLQSLQRAFKRWVHAACTKSMKICFFLDGLDEYEGDQESIVEFFKMLASDHPSQVKMCISSRPWVVFDEAFRGLPGLRLQDLTYNDIKLYVQDKLHTHPRMKQLTREDPLHAAELVTEIVTKASGVFLWVMLIVRSLLTGLRNRDDVPILQKRLRDLPADLSTLYTHMLNHVEPLYNEQASMAFQIYNALANNNSAVTALELDLAITASSDKMSSSTNSVITNEEVQATGEHLDIYLKTRCAGLLEIQTENLEGALSLSDNAERIAAIKPTEKVNYLHRTVKDFLDTEDVRAKLASDVKPGFDPHTWVIRFCVIRLMRSIFLGVEGLVCAPTNSEIWSTMTNAMKHAKEADTSGDLSHIDALDALFEAGRRAWNFNLDPWVGGDRVPTFYQITPSTCPWDSCDQNGIWERNYWGAAIIHNLLAYVESKLRTDRSMNLSRVEIPLLDFALDSRYENRPWDFVSLRMVNLLLRYDGDPNQHWRRGTHFAHVIDVFERNARAGMPFLGLDKRDKPNPYRRGLEVWAAVFRSLFRYGAGNLSAGLYGVNDLEFFRQRVLVLFEDNLPSAVPELKQALDERLHTDRRANNPNPHRRKRSLQESGHVWRGGHRKRYRNWR
jgi:NACHT domain